jgi:hypothetical protein
MRARSIVILAGALLLSLPGFAASDVRRMEAVGAVGIDPEAEVSGTPRDRARFAAVRDAVRRIALELVPEELRPKVDPKAEKRDPNFWIEQALGSDPYDYAQSFRLLEDRGSRPALLTPEVETEYVVVVEVFIDEARVRDRLAARGLLPEELAEDRTVVEIDLEVSSYRAYERLRQALLEARGVHAAFPLEMSRGNVRLAVEADIGAEPLLAGLIRRTPPELRIELLGVGDDHARLRVDWAEVPANEEEARDAP